MIQQGFGRPALAAAAAIVLATAGPVARAQTAAPLPAAGSPEEVGFSSERLKRLDAFMAKVVADGEVAGASTYLARRGRVVAFNTYGKRDLGTGAPVAEDTIFRIYSMTKPVTGVALMMLFEEGKWRLDDPVTKFIPQFSALKVLAAVDAAGNPVLEPMKRPPTMRELMSHTAGFVYGRPDGNPVERMYEERGVMASDGLQQMIDKLAGVPLLFQPGERWNYSVAVDIQGYIVERLSGQSLGEFMQQRIFGPLKMVDTGFHAPPDKHARLAGVYGRDPATGKLVDAFGLPGGRRDTFRAPPRLESGGGGLVSTTTDYARFAQMLANGGELEGVRILSPSSVELMRTNVLSEAAMDAPGWTYGRNVGFGLDLMVVTSPREAGRPEGQDTFSWEGAAGTFFWVDPTNDVVFIGMVQNFQRAAPTNSLDTQARPLVYQALVDPAK